MAPCSCSRGSAQKPFGGLGLTMPGNARSCVLSIGFLYDELELQTTSPAFSLRFVCSTLLQSKCHKRETETPTSRCCRRMVRDRYLRCGSRSILRNGAYLGRKKMALWGHILSGSSGVRMEKPQRKDARHEGRVSGNCRVYGVFTGERGKQI